ncbi:MAG: hypothetical protein BAA01_06220 [Bacillus thermozeamaize]|uniref:LysM domain-containing protein n=1 Tax=Bacillus thermozeamaize TaxID=230954 RepID=A0A1Y3PM93_9BACI|nr:MAG: hypothetical protein BAA01_06220 [Bacillus thermozeamaize]
MSEQSPVLRLDFHERLTLELFKGRVEEILNLELVPDVEVASEETQITLRGQMVVRGIYLAESLPLTAYELEQDRPQDEEQVERTSEPYPFVYHIPLEIVLPRERVPEPEKLRLVVTQMDFEMIPPNDLEVLAELAVEGVFERPPASQPARTEEAAETLRFTERLKPPDEWAYQPPDEWAVEVVAGRVTREDGQEADGKQQEIETDQQEAETEREGLAEEDEFLLVARPKTEQAENKEEHATAPEKEAELAAQKDAEPWPNPDADEEGETGEADAQEAVQMGEAEDLEAEDLGETEEPLRVTVSAKRLQDQPKLSSLLEGMLGKSVFQAPDEAGEQHAIEEETVDFLSDDESFSPVLEADEPEDPAWPTVSGPGDSEAFHEELHEDELEDRLEEQAVPTVSDYLSPILQGKEERFASIRVYRVKESERLEDVAMQFDVNLEELMRMNRLTHATFLEEGNLLMIPLKKDT